MTTPSKKIKYFRSCFEADNRSLQLHSFFGNKVSQPKIIAESDLLTGQLPYLPVDLDWGAESLKKLTLYAKEKNLYCGAFFVFGTTYVMNKKQKLIAPLLLYPAELVEEDELHRVELLSLQPILNPAAIAPLQLKNYNLNAFDELSKHLPNGNFRFQEGVLLHEALDNLFVNLNTSSLLKYPDIVSPTELQNLRKSTKLFKEDNQFHLISTIGLGILDKMKSGRGILNELEEIAEASDLSAPLEVLLSKKKNNIEVKEIDTVFTPVTLNKAQEKLIKNAHRSNLSVAIGPPGTGKSFTIAALTIDAIARGESVLIASNNFQAVEVIAQKLEKDFNLQYKPVKTTEKKWKKKAKEHLENLLNGIGVKWVSSNELNDLLHQTKESIRNIKKIETKIDLQIEQEKKWGKEKQKKNIGVWGRFQLWRLENQMQKNNPLWILYQELQAEIKFKNNFLKKYISAFRTKHLYELLVEKRNELKYFLKALQARTGSLKEERFDQVDFQTLLQALPIWLVTVEEISQVLPLQKEMFDLVIFDEATQCNISSALPVLQRANRAVIVGDPKQLRHISFLSSRRQEQLLLQQEIELEELEDLNYRKKSLLDFASDQISNQENIHFLNEHYRSLPDLIAFSNKKFYGNSMSLMTDTPTTSSNGNLHIHRVVGKRIRKGHNQEEADIILKKVMEIVEREIHLHRRLCQSIGILSPFRAQSDILSSMIEKEIRLSAIKRHKILVGTPHFFQGEERDIMFLSFALDDESHPSAFRYLNKADVFNVSITRARSEQHLFVSFDPSLLSNDLLLKEYLTVSSPLSTSKSPAEHPTIHDEFMTEVVDVLQDFSLDQILQHYHIAGLDVDIVLVHSNTTYCIDLVGYPGIYEAAFPLERIKMFQRMQIEVFSMPYFLWTVNREKCIMALREFLNLK